MASRGRKFRNCLQLALMLLASLGASRSAARAAENDLSQPRFWLVRTYGLGDPGQAEADVRRLDIQQLRDSRWSRATVDELAAATAERTTVVYVHGNRGSDELAITRGTRLGAVLAARADSPPLQIVIWSWPSGQVLRGRRDFVFKAERTDTEAWYLAALLRRFEPEAKVSLLGYSYGARVVTGALHWRAGGRFEGRDLPGDLTTSRYRVALLAPAVNVDWVAADGSHGELWAVTDRLLLLYNPCDPALRWYRLLYRQQRTAPLGRHGVADAWLGDGAARVEQWNVSSAIGRTHDENAFLDSPWIADQIGDALLGRSAPAP